MSKKIIPLGMYLLKIIFSQKRNLEIQNKAIDLLMENLAQRKVLRDEISKINLIINDEDSKIYNRYKDHYSRLQKLLYHIVQDDMEYLIFQNLEKERYKNRIRDTTIVIKNIKSSLRLTYNCYNSQEIAIKV
jgi:hypothetical protein